MNALKGYLLAALLGIGAILLAFVGGRQAGGSAARRQAEEKAAAERHEREAAAAKAAVDAVEGRQQVVNEIDAMESDDVRQNLTDRWTRD